MLERDGRHAFSRSGPVTARTDLKTLIELKPYDVSTMVDSCLIVSP